MQNFILILSPVLCYWFGCFASYILSGITKDASTKNIAKIVSAVISFVIITSFCVIINCLTYDEISFRYSVNPETGLLRGFWETIIYYGFVLFTFGLIPCCISFLYAQGVYFFIHRKAPDVFSKKRTPEYEGEFHTGGKVAFIASFVAEVFVFFLHALSVIDIRI